MALTEKDAELIAKKAVIETLNSLGLDTHNMREMQADMIFLRKLRKGNSKLVLSLVLLGMGGMVTFLFDKLT